MDRAARNRLGLWLRSERAFGLPSVVLPGAPTAEAAANSANDPDQLTEPAPPAEAPVVMPPASPRATVRPPGATDLFAPAADQPSFDAPGLSPEDKRARLMALDDKEVRGCTKCRLCETRTNTVFGEG